MKKVLYVSFIAPSERYGGGICVIQSLYSLSRNAEIDYIGPFFDELEIGKYNIKLASCYIIKKDISKIQTAKSVILHRANSEYYNAWNRTVNKIDISKYDCCYIEFTKASFIVKWAQKHNLPVIMRAHNVELDFLESCKKGLSSIFKILLCKKDERYCINNANKILALTLDDKKRFIELYGNKQNIDILPICVNEFNDNKIDNLPSEYILITGSFWFGPNLDGTIWFLDKVWSKISSKVTDKYSLVLAGANPSDELKKLVSNLSNVYLFENPPQIDSYYLHASIYVAPIFYGAGMKVKIAEALSCGLPVVTTIHAFKGYENADEFIYTCQNENDFINILEKLSSVSDEKMKQQRNDIKKVFADYFSLNYSANEMSKIL